MFAGFIACLNIMTCVCLGIAVNFEEQQFSIVTTILSSQSNFVSQRCARRPFFFVCEPSFFVAKAIDRLLLD